MSQDGHTPGDLPVSPSEPRAEQTIRGDALSQTGTLVTYPGMTRNQQHVLLTLAQRGASSVTDWAVWYPMREGQVRGVIRGLYRKGLVDVAGWDGRSRTYAITDKGLEALRPGT